MELSIYRQGSSAGYQLKVIDKGLHYRLRDFSNIIGWSFVNAAALKVIVSEYWLADGTKVTADILIHFLNQSNKPNFCTVDEL